MCHARFAVLTIALSGCGGVEEFERELTGRSAVAWQTCKEALGDARLSYPRLIEADSERIYFGWETAEAHMGGGPIFCVTDGTGEELLEARIAGAPVG